jgi:hypothetical protein
VDGAGWPEAKLKARRARNLLAMQRSQRLKKRHDLAVVFESDKHASPMFLMAVPQVLPVSLTLKQLNY